MTNMVITREIFSHFRCHMEIAHQFLVDMQKIVQTLNTLWALFKGHINNMQMTRRILSNLKIQFLKKRKLPVYLYDRLRNSHKIFQILLHGFVYLYSGLFEPYF